MLDVTIFLPDNELDVNQKQTSGNNHIKIVGLILQYTKTTDSANSFNFGNTTDYSTDEKIIGTWIDGSYIYQKTINFGELSNRSSKDVAHGISNLGYVINIFATGKDNTNNRYSPFSKVHDRDASSQCCIYVDSTNISIENRSSNFSDWSCYVTLQYTKNNS